MFLLCSNVDFYKNLPAILNNARPLVTMKKKQAKATPLVRGIQHFLAGILLILRPGVKRWVFIPFLINTVLFIALLSYAWGQIPLLREQFSAWLPEFLGFLTLLLWPLFLLSAWLFIVFGFALFANIIAAPFNGPLSAAVTKHLTGTAPNSPSSGFISGFFGAIFDEIRKLIYSLSRLLLVAILFLIPLVNLIAPFVMMYYSTWLLAQQYMDYPMGNAGLGFKAQRQQLKTKRGMMLGFGGMAAASTLVPFVNVLAVPIGVAGATALYCEEYAD